MYISDNFVSLSFSNVLLDQTSQMYLRLMCDAGRVCLVVYLKLSIISKTPGAHFTNMDIIESKHE